MAVTLSLWCQFYTFSFWLQSIGNLAAQDFHQRTLSSSSTSTARLVCFIAAGVVILAAIPSTLIGAVAASTGDLIHPPFTRTRVVIFYSHFSSQGLNMNFKMDSVVQSISFQFFHFITFESLLLHYRLELHIIWISVSL